MGEWRTRPLSDFVDPDRSICYGIVQPGSAVDNGVPIVRVNNFIESGVDTSNALKVDAQIESKYRRSRLQGGELLITLVGSLGLTAIASEELRGWNVARAVGVVPLRSDADKRWINFVVRSKPAQDFIRMRANTTVQATFNLKDLAELPIPCPPDSARIEMSAILSSLDDKIELNRRMSETLEAMVRAIFKDWFVDFGPTRAKMEGRARYLASDIWSIFPDRLEEEGMPNGWELRPVGDFAELRGGKQLEKQRITSIGVIPVFGGAGIMGFTDEHNAEGFVISVGRVGAYCGQFFSHRGKAWINNNASQIRQLPGVSGEWLFQSLRHADIEVIKKGAAQPFVSNTDVSKMPIIWPGDRVVGGFADIAVPLMLKMEHNHKESSNLAETRDFLISRLMSGEIRVKDAEKLVGEAT